MSPGRRHDSDIRACTKGSKAFAVLERGQAKQTEILTDVVASYTVRDGALTIETAQGARTFKKGNPLTKLEEELSLHQAKHDVLGYLGYDCARYLEDIAIPMTPSIEPEAQFFVFRKKQTIETVVGPKPRKPKALPITAKASPDFSSQISRVRAHIKEGDIFQCVLSQKFSEAFEGDGISLYATLRQTNPSPYHFLIQGIDFALVGASPEPLIKVKNGIIETHPIAGTRPRGKTSEEEKRFERQLKASVKERAEHLMLVDLSRNDLGRVCEPGSVSVKSFRRVERFSHVMHLVSTVEGRLKADISSFKALFSCFPAGTLTGAPKVRAMQIISELEPVRRGAYGGAIVFAEKNGTFDSCITIRSAVLKNHQAYFQAGAGIVADSSAGREYAEILNKSAAVRHALGVTA